MFDSLADSIPEDPTVRYPRTVWPPRLDFDRSQLLVRLDM